jgi:hypothetical protein
MVIQIKLVIFVVHVDICCVDEVLVVDFELFHYLHGLKSKGNVLFQAVNQGNIVLPIQGCHDESIDECAKKGIVVGRAITQDESTGSCWRAVE